MTDEEKNSIELDIEAKYVGRKEKEFLNSIAYAECLYILDTKNNYCDDIKNLSLLKIVDIIEKQSKEIEEYKKQLDLDNECEIALNSKVMDLEKEIEELKNTETYKLAIIDKDKYISKDKIKPIQIIDLDGKIHNVYKIEEK